MGTGLLESTQLPFNTEGLLLEARWARYRTIFRKRQPKSHVYSPICILRPVTDFGLGKDALRLACRLISAYYFVFAAQKYHPSDPGSRVVGRRVLETTMRRTGAPKVDSAEMAPPDPMPLIAGTAKQKLDELFSKLAQDWGWPCALRAVNEQLNVDELFVHTSDYIVPVSA